MPLGTLSIVREGLKPATYEVTFAPDDRTSAAGGSLTLQGAESLRPFLESIDVGARERDDAVRDAIQTGEATIVHVVLSQEFIDQHGL